MKFHEFHRNWSIWSEIEEIRMKRKKNIQPCSGSMYDLTPNTARKADFPIYNIEYSCERLFVSWDLYWIKIAKMVISQNIVYSVN